MAVGPGGLAGPVVGAMEVIDGDRQNISYV